MNFIGQSMRYSLLSDSLLSPRKTRLERDKPPRRAKLIACGPVRRAPVSEAGFGSRQAGEAEDISVSDGKDSVNFGAGDLVIFPVDLKCTWNVQEPVRKYYNFG